MQSISTVYSHMNTVSARAATALRCRGRGRGKEKENVLAEPATVALSEVVLPAAGFAEVGDGGQFGVQGTACRREQTLASKKSASEPSKRSTHARNGQHHSRPFQKDTRETRMRGRRTDRHTSACSVPRPPAGPRPPSRTAHKRCRSSGLRRCRTRASRADCRT